MGRTLEKVRVTNYLDIAKAGEGLIKEDKIRSIKIEAVVDTGATFLCLPREVIEKLGLICRKSLTIVTANGKAKRRIFAVAQIEIKDRVITMDVMENDDETPALIGYLVLEAMDFVVDPKTQAVIPNPAHDGKWTADLYLGYRHG